MAGDPISPTGVAVLGSTGSIGASTLAVVARHPERFRVVAVSANARIERLWEQVRDFEPAYAVVMDEDDAATLAGWIRAAGARTKVWVGQQGLEAVAAAPEVDAVMAAIVGIAGMASTLAAAHAGKRVLVANKEALVAGGALVTAAARASGATLLPIDSEHNAVFQCLPAPSGDDADTAGVDRMLLTASGGPFLRHAADSLADVTPEQACDHPTWSMGRKISVDSATMMNKGLEVIEACWLFSLAPDRVEVAVHPQSRVHALVQYVDGSTLAELGHADMRTPIAHALAWPERIEAGVDRLDPFELPALVFERPDFFAFPALQLAYDAARAGGVAGAVINAANEIAVERFLDHGLAFPAIQAVVAATLERVDTSAPASSLEAVRAADDEARRAAAEEAERACARGDR